MAQGWLAAVAVARVCVYFPTLLWKPHSRHTARRGFSPSLSESAGNKEEDHTTNFCSATARARRPTSSTVTNMGCFGRFRPENASAEKLRKVCNRRSKGKGIFRKSLDHATRSAYEEMAALKDQIIAAADIDRILAKGCELVWKKCQPTTSERCSHRAGISPALAFSDLISAAVEMLGLEPSPHASVEQQAVQCVQVLAGADEMDAGCALPSICRKLGRPSTLVSSDGRRWVYDSVLAAGETAAQDALTARSAFAAHHVGRSTSTRCVVQKRGYGCSRKQ